MAEEQNTRNTDKPVEQGYYKDTSSKVTDFLVGFLGYPIVTLLAQLAFAPSARGLGGTDSVVMAVISLVLTVAFVIFAYKRGRKFIAIGIISLLIVPVIAAGSCLLMLMAMR